MIIKTSDNQFIKVDGSIEQVSSNCHCWCHCWGWRWNRNENRFGTQCTLQLFDKYVEVTEDQLPKKLPPLEKPSGYSIHFYTGSKKEDDFSS